MIINPLIVEKTWGREEHIVNNKMYCGKRMLLTKDHYCSIHFHMIKTETFYIRTGTMFLQLWDASGNITSYILKNGDCCNVKCGTPHRFYGITDVEFFEFSIEDKESDSYRIDKSGSGCPESIKFILSKMIKDNTNEIFLNDIASMVKKDIQEHETILASTQTKNLIRGSGSALMCNHANESPIDCICEEWCYCKTRTCKSK